MFAKITTVLIAFMLFGLASNVASAHPSDGYEPNNLQPGYGTDRFGYNPEWDTNELYFIRPYPSPDSLTDAEKYVLAGTTESDQVYGLAPWYDQIFTYVWVYEAITGSVPTELSQSVLDVVFQDHSVTQQKLDVVTSPISGQLPKLNSEEFSPGDLYVRKLTEEEKLHFAELSPRWKMMWYDGVMPTGNNCLEPITMLTDVYYMRIYGEESEIMTRIIFNWQ